MPFAEYKNFNDCLAKNKGKENPKAYCAEIQRKTEKGDKERKFLSGITFKEEDGLLWIEGPINAPVVDDVNDFLPAPIQQKIVDQINAGFNKGSKHHEADPDPVWIAKQAYLNDGKSFIKGYLNKYHPEYEKTSWEVQNGILDTFSIEFLKDPQSHVEAIDGKQARVFDDIQLRGIGLASKGRAINPSLEPLSFYVKEMIPLDIEKKEVPKMEASKEAHDMKCKEGEHEVEGKCVPMEKDMHKEESSAYTISKEDYEQFVRFKDMGRKEAEENEFSGRFQRELQKLQVKSKPLLQAGAFDVKEGSAALKEYKEAFTNGAMKLSVGEKFDRATILAKEMGMFANGIPNSSFRPKDFKCSGPLGQNIEIKENRVLEVKALTTTTNDPASIAVANYYQAAVELGDFYDPAIVDVINDKQTTFGRLSKRDMSKFSAIQVRVRYGRNTSALSYTEGAEITKDNVDRIRLSQPFKYYAAGVQVTGQMIASARANGGVGDIFNIEVQDASKDLLDKVNNDLLNTSGAAAGAQQGDVGDKEIMSFEFLCDSTNNTTIYGLTRSSYTFLATGSNTAAGSTAITKQRLRTLIQALEKNGANRNDLVIFTSFEQRDMIFKLYDDAQRFLGVSARGGFEGLPTFDGIPIFADFRCNTDHLFCIDTGVTYMGIQVAPTFEKLAQSDDSQSGFIKTYLNLMCEAPFRCGQIDGLSTS